MLPEHAPFACERLVAALRFLIDADPLRGEQRPDHGITLLTYATEVTAQAVTAHHAN